MSIRNKRQKIGQSSSLIPQRRLRELYAGLVRCQILRQQLASGAAGLGIHARQGDPAPAVAIATALRGGDVIATSPGDLLPEFVRSRRRLQAFVARLMGADRKSTR